MLKSEFIEMGGKDEDFAKANEIYTEFDLWLDRHEFFIWWSRFGADSNSYMELLHARRAAKRVQETIPNLFVGREIMLRYAEKEAQKTRQKIEKLKAELKRLNIIALELNKNTELYNR